MRCQACGEDYSDTKECFCEWDGSNPWGRKVKYVPFIPATESKGGQNVPDAKDIANFEAGIRPAPPMGSDGKMHAQLKNKVWDGKKWV